MKSRGLFFLGIALLVTALVLAIVSGLITPDMLERGGGTTAHSAPPAVGGTQTAREAFEKVTAWAAAQDRSVEPVSVSAVLRRGESTTSWTFQIYQPKNKKLLIVTVDNDTVRVLRQQTALYAQHPFSSDHWAVDSDAVLNEWWAHSGQNTWQQPDAWSLNLHLGRDAEGTSAWTVTVLDTESEVLDVFRIHAETGAIIPLTRGEP